MSYNRTKKKSLILLSRTKINEHFSLTGTAPTVCSSRTRCRENETRLGLGLGHTI